MAVAEEARLLQPSAEASPCITALLDARMDEMYVQRYASKQGGQGVLKPLGACELMHPEHLLIEANTLYAGNVFDVYSDRLPPGLKGITCLPTAAALLRLAPQLAASGQCVSAAQALPLYIRDKVAQTTVERETAKAVKMLAANTA